MNVNHLAAEVALAERFALLQRVTVYPASVRREVIRESLSGLRDTAIATGLNLPLSDVRAIMEAFRAIADEQAL